MQTDSSSSSQEVLIAFIGDIGIDYRCYKWMLSLKKMGYKPILYCDKPFTPPGEQWKEFDIRILTSTSHLQAFSKTFLQFTLRIIPILFRSKSRLWIAMDAPPLLPLAWLGKCQGRKFIYDAREIFPETPFVQNRWSRKIFWTLWHKFGLLVTPKLTTVSPYFEKYFQQNFPRSKIYLLPNVPFSTSINYLVPKSLVINKPVMLIFQGILRIGSGLLEVIEALKNNSEFVLDIYGSGEEHVLLEQKVRSLGLNSRVKFYGMLSFEKLQPAMQNADIGLHLVQPLTLSIDYTLPNKIFDYIQAGLPVLLGNTTAHREFLKENPIGVLCDPYSSESILQSLKTIVENLPTYQASCEKAKKIWCWENFEAGLQKFLS